MLIHGKVDSRQDTASILVESIETLDGMGEKKEREVFIKVPKEATPATLQSLKSLLTQNLGDQAAYVVFEGGKKIKLPFKINWTETLARTILDLLEGSDDFRVQ